MMKTRFYLRKIGEHMQEFAVLAAVFVPLDMKLTIRNILVLWIACGAIIIIGIEMERRFSDDSNIL